MPPRPQAKDFILRLLARGPLTSSQLAERTSGSGNAVRTALYLLVRDGLVVRDGETYRLAR